MEKYYQLNKVNEVEGELLIYGAITSDIWQDSDIGSLEVKKQIEELNVQKLNVKINSYGGEVKEGLGIYNILKQFDGEVVTYIDGFACSAASVIFCAGTKRIMPKSSLMMIHNAWSFFKGDHNELRKAADDLEKVTSPSIEIYKTVSNLSEEEIKQMLDDETWLTADECLNFGFATEISESEAKQSLQDNILHKLVLKTKNQEKELEELKQIKQEKKAPIDWNAFF